MRTEEFNGHEITYPDDICFVFNPQVVTISSTVNVTTKITGNGKTYTDLRSPRNGKVSLDISGYMRPLFVIGNEMLDFLGVHVSLEIGSINFQFVVHCIWGAMNIGEVFNASRVVTVFRKFPFTLGMHLPSDSSLYFRHDKEGYKPIDSISPYKLNHDVSNIFHDVSNFGVFRISSTNGAPSSFSYAFDRTFRVSGRYTLVRVLVDNSECGVYLRWIDRHGFYQYFLFKDGDKISQSSNEGDLIRQDFNDSNYSYNGVSRYQGKTMKNTIKACATLVNKETFNMLSSLHSSPLVDLYIDGNWIPVNIVAGILTNAGRELQDFEIQITMPEDITQML